MPAQGIQSLQTFGTEAGWSSQVGASILINIQCSKRFEYFRNFHVANKRKKTSTVLDMKIRVVLSILVCPNTFII